MTSTTRELADYYANLLIMQYLDKPKAYATIQAVAGAVIFPQTSVQTLVFSPAPTAGAFTLSYDGQTTASIAFNDAVATVQTKLRALTGLGSITVTGSIAAGLTVTFTGVLPPAFALETASSTLTGAGSVAVGITITETDEIIPLAIQNAFNLTGSSTAVGDQLDILGKYVGVSRTGQGFTSPITLNDADYLTLIRMGIIRNAAGSDLFTIQTFLNDFFPGLIQVIDTQDMHMEYLISTGIGSSDLMQMFVTQNLLPKPMGVGVSVVVFAPDITAFFGFRTYAVPNNNATPFNSYADYDTDTVWLSYSDAP